jgi:hypothetical protein
LSFKKGKHIENLDVRYLYYVNANSLHARGEFTNVNEEDKIMLTKAAFPNYDMTPNLGAMLLFKLDHQDHPLRGDITCRGIAPFLAPSLVSTYVTFNLWMVRDVLHFEFLELMSSFLRNKEYSFFIILELGARSPLFCLRIYSLPRCTIA